MGGRPFSLTRAPLLFSLILVSLLAACRPAPKPPEKPVDKLLLLPADWDNLAGFSEDALIEALPALRRSCGAILARAPDAPFAAAAPWAGENAAWQEPCRELMALGVGDERDLRALVLRAYRPLLASNDGKAEGLFTGYFEMELEAAREPSPDFAAPIYARPSDIVQVNLGDFRDDLEGENLVGRVEKGRLLPYHTRAEIDGKNALAGRDLELFWLRDAVDAFFLQVQGSGLLRLEGGESKRVGYAAHNGKSFTAIGRYMIDNGLIPAEGVSMQSIRDWLRAHPAQAREILFRNERYIFFREITGDGPIGAAGLVLTPGRSLAVDPSFIPLGAPLWLETKRPSNGAPLNRLMVAQDTGGAIKGPVRGDFFWGTGEAALAEAGGMKASGRYFVLLPRSLAERALIAQAKSGS